MNVRKQKAILETIDRLSTVIERLSKHLIPPPIRASIANERGEIVSEVTLNGTAGPKTVKVVGVDADGNPTGPLPHGTGWPVLTSGNPDICSVTASENDAFEPVLILDPSGPSVGDVTITAQPQLENGDFLAAFEFTVHVHAGNPVTADIDASSLG